MSYALGKWSPHSIFHIFQEEEKKNEGKVIFNSLNYYFFGWRESWKKRKGTTTLAAHERPKWLSKS